MQIHLFVESCSPMNEQLMHELIRIAAILKKIWLTQLISQQISIKFQVIQAVQE